MTFLYLHTYNSLQNASPERDNDSPASVTLYPAADPNSPPVSPSHTQQQPLTREVGQGHDLIPDQSKGSISNVGHGHDLVPSQSKSAKLLRNLPSYESTVAHIGPIEEQLKGIQSGEMIDYLLEERGFFKCKCGCLFADQVNYSLHKKMHYFDDILKCSFCETKFETLEELFAHFQSHEKWGFKTKTMI